LTDRLGLQRKEKCPLGINLTWNGSEICNRFDDKEGNAHDIVDFSHVALTSKETKTRYAFSLVRVLTTTDPTTRYPLEVRKK